MSHHRLRHVIVPACALLVSCGESTDDVSPGDGVDQLERRLELRHHEALLARMTAPDSALMAFTTDGCSGGLSVGWEYLAEHIDALQEKHGLRPPWETCCVEHDRRYHTGATIGATAEESFVARKRADLALHACVLATGKNRAEELSIEYGVTPESVHTLYTAIAELMYRAVRAGGMPCSGLPWRWGYGWPACG
jgi:hypothetical protein